jgi:hypothetical protein
VPPPERGSARGDWVDHYAVAAISHGVGYFLRTLKSGHSPGMPGCSSAPTTVSRLMAAKRRHLVPIYDAYRVVPGRGG